MSDERVKLGHDDAFLDIKVPFEWITAIEKGYDKKYNGIKCYVIVNINDQSQKIYITHKQYHEYKTRFCKDYLYEEKNRTYSFKQPYGLQSEIDLFENIDVGSQEGCEIPYYWIEFGDDDDDETYHITREEFYDIKRELYRNHNIDEAKKHEIECMHDWVREQMSKEKK